MGAQTEQMARLSLACDEVHVWRAALDVPAAHLGGLAQTLCKGELQRANRFRFNSDRRRFVAARGTLRVLLGRYLGVDPAGVRFRYGENGKPALDLLAGEPHLRFNVAHSEDLALYAFALGREVGVDLERLRPILEAERIAEAYFSARERAVLHELAPSQRLEAFYACWTRKEAYIKARGDGLSRPLDRFSVSLAPDEPARLLDVPDDPRELDRWSLLELEPAPGYVAALAVEGEDWALACWQVPASTDASEIDAGFVHALWVVKHHD